MLVFVKTARNERGPAVLRGLSVASTPSCARLVPASTERVQRSMAYTLLAPSKRVRPVLTLLSAELCGGEARARCRPRAPIELVHASSLILDDLPSMDDAALRRGRPANHLEFGEAIAILAAFGLLNLAFGAIARALRAGARHAADGALSDAVGPEA